MAQTSKLLRCNMSIDELLELLETAKQKHGGSTKVAYKYPFGDRHYQTKVAGTVQDGELMRVEWSDYSDSMVVLEQDRELELEKDSDAVEVFCLY